jgi:hypothetical protein
MEIRQSNGIQLPLLIASEKSQARFPAIWPVGPPKLMKPSFSQNRKASPKLGCRPSSGGLPSRLSGLELDDIFITF